jgi:hypothetical protein
MQSEQTIAVVVFLIFLAVSVAGYFMASRAADRLDRRRRTSEADVTKPGVRM